MPHLPTQMLIEAGIIPKNTLQQLARWRLLPEDCTESHGVHPVRLDASNPEELHSFLKELGAAITQDMAAIRETELDHPGGFQRAQVLFEDSRGNEYEWNQDVFVDALGRVITPVDDPWRELAAVKFASEPRRKMVKRETRYEGDKVVAFVVYLEAKKE